VLARGELEVRRRGARPEAADIVLARLGAGTLFGEMALLSRAPRAASVVVCRPSVVLVARKEALDAVAAEQPELGAEVAAHCRLRMVENLVRTSSILSRIRPSERPDLIERFVTKAFEEGETLIAQGQESDGLYLIASGGVEVVHREGNERTVIASLGVGEVVGEVALVLRRPANANVIAALPTVTLHLRRERFQQLITAYPTMLTELYQLAVQREEETMSIVAQEAMEADELIII
jgi:cAMP-dependent protein kinase regulator